MDATADAIDLAMDVFKVALAKKITGNAWATWRHKRPFGQLAPIFQLWLLRLQAR